MAFDGLGWSKKWMGEGREGICDQVSGKQKQDSWICTNWRGNLLEMDKLEQVKDTVNGGGKAGGRGSNGVRC